MAAVLSLSLLISGIYLVAAVVAAAAGLRALHDPGSVPPSRQPELDLILRGVVLRNRDRRLHKFLALPSTAWAWPVAGSGGQFLSRHSDRSHVAMRRLRPRTLRIGQGLLVLSLITLMAYRYGLVHPEVAVTFGVVTIIASVTRLASFVAVPLPTLVRRSRGRPYLNFLAVAVVDAGTLVTSCSVLVATADGGSVTVDTILGTARGIFDLPGNLVGLFDLQARQAGLAAIGAVYAAALTRAVMSFDQFRRTDADLLELAFAEQQLGDTRAADAWLDQLDDRNSTTAYWIRASRAMAQGQFRRALQLQRRFFEAGGEEVSEVQVWHSLGPVAWHSGLDPKRVEELISFVISQADDVAAAHVVADALPLHGDPQRLSADLLAGPEAQPATRAILLLSAGRPEEARRLLLYAGTPDPFSTVFVLAWQGVAGIHVAASQGVLMWLEEWRTDLLPRLRDQASELPVSEMDMAAKLFVILEVSLEWLLALPSLPGVAAGRDRYVDLQREMAQLADQLAESPSQLERFRALSRQLQRNSGAVGDD